MKPRKKPKLSAELSRLYDAVTDYVKLHGGTVAVVGSVTIQEWPDDDKNTFHVAVKCLGAKPHFKGETTNRIRLA